MLQDEKIDDEDSGDEEEVKEKDENPVQLLKAPKKPPTPMSLFTAVIKDRMKSSEKFAGLSSQVCHEL